MSNSKEPGPEHIIVLRRRASGEDESHHGGVWKIAYADFMTAMMAFFLVMWLINAANTETKASVASYFNPIKLTDNVARRKGLFAVDEKANASDKTDGKSPKASPETNPAKPRREADAPPVGKELPSQRGADVQRPSLDEVDSIARASLTHRQTRFDPLGETRVLAQAGPSRETEIALPRDGTSEAPSSAAVPSASTRGSDAAVGEPASNDPSTSPALEASPVSDGSRHPLAETADVIRRESEAAIRRLGLTGGPGIDVAIEGDTIVLSLTDTSTFGMFAVGSADPNGELVALLQDLAPVLAAKSETIILRGHTDGRPYRMDKRNRNWRLAMERAEVAYELLVRSGIEDVRFERVEAHADRKLKVAHDPEAAANRRIEIIIRRGAP